MRKFVIPAIVVLGLGAFAVRAVWFSDARAVRRQLDALAQAATTPVGESDLERVARLVRLGNMFTDDVVVRRDASAFVGGRQAVLSMVVQGANQLGRITVAMDDVEVAVADRANATAFLTLHVTGTTDPPLAPRQVSATFVKQRGTWLVARGEVLRTLDTAK